MHTAIMRFRYRWALMIGIVCILAVRMAPGENEAKTKGNQRAEPGGLLQEIAEAIAVIGGTLHATSPALQFTQSTLLAAVGIHCDCQVSKVVADLGDGKIDDSVERTAKNLYAHFQSNTELKRADCGGIPTCITVVFTGLPISEKDESIVLLDEYLRCESVPLSSGRKSSTGLAIQVLIDRSNVDKGEPKTVPATVRADVWSYSIGIVPARTNDKRWGVNVRHVEFVWRDNKWNVAGTERRP